MVSITAGIIGVILLVIGIIIIFSIIGIGAMFLGPFILLFFGIVLIKKRIHLIGYALVAFGILALFNLIFSIHLGEILLAVIFLYIGVRLLKKKDSPYSQNKKQRGDYTRTIDSDDKDWAKAGHGQTTKQKSGPTLRKSFIGDLHLMHDSFELEDMNIWHGIGDVKIDLSKAMIPEGETELVISGWVGDIDIYIPYDIDVSVEATVTFGELEILNRRQGGIRRQLSVATKEYPESKRRVKIILSLFLGDIDVRFL